MRTHAYLRISQDRTGLAAGVARQQEDCERRARERGWTITATHTDNDQSASTGRRRPGYEAMLTAIEAGQVDVVVAWSLDRLQRNRRDEVRLYEACRDRQVTLSLVNGSDLDFGTAAGRFVADSLGAVARMEVEMKSDRQRRAAEQAAAAGRRLGGRRPFGYDTDGTTIREDEAQAVRDGYAAFLAGVPIAGVVRDWNRRDLVTGQGGTWKHDTVRAALLNPRYMGKRAYLGQVVADATWPGLVSEETWQAVHAVLTDPSRRSTPKGGRYLLSGLALCGVCDALVHAGGNTRKGHRGYRCSGSMGHFARMALPAEDYVSAVVVERLSRPDAALLLSDQEQPDLGALRAEAMALRGRLDGVAVEFADGVLTASQLRTITTRLRARLSEVEGATADAGRVDVLGPLVGAEDVRAAWEALTVERQRAVIDLLMVVRLMPPGRGTRTFRPDTVQIEPKVP